MNRYSLDHLRDTTNERALQTALEMETQDREEKLFASIARREARRMSQIGGMEAARQAIEFICKDGEAGRLRPDKVEFVKNLRNY